MSMKKIISFTVAAVVLVFCLASAALVPEVFASETIVFPDDGTKLQIDPFDNENALFPGTTSDPGLSNNSVTVNSGEIAGDVFGGVTNDDKNVENNHVLINGGRATSSVYGGRSANGATVSNDVTINGGVTLAIFGGHSGGSSTGNSVTVNSGVTARIMGGRSTNGNATLNNVLIDGGEITEIMGGRSVNGDATNNTVTIRGGKIDMDIFGGSSVYGAATHNRVVLSGTPTLDSATGIYGGDTSDGTDAFTGNTMVLSSVGLKVRELANFQYLEFIFPNDIKPGDTLLSADNAKIGQAIVEVKFNDPHKPSSLPLGAVITLIKGGASGTPFNSTAAAGCSDYDYTFNLHVADNNLYATVASVSSTHRSSGSSGCNAMSAGAAGMSAIILAFWAKRKRLRTV